MEKIDICHEFGIYYFESIDFGYVFSIIRVSSSKATPSPSPSPSPLLFVFVPIHFSHTGQKMTAPQEWSALQTIFSAVIQLWEVCFVVCVYCHNHINTFKVVIQNFGLATRRWLARTLFQDWYIQVTNNISALLVLNILLLEQQQLTEYNIRVSAKHDFFFKFSTS